MKYIIVSYYTENTGYKAQAMRLAVSAERFGLPWHIEGIPNIGSWQENTRYKAAFIMAMMERFPNKAIVFIDADAIIRKKPKLFEALRCDIAVSYRDYALFPCRSRKYGKELLSGTLYLANNRKTKEFVKLWIDKNNERPLIWEQKNMELALNETIGHLKLKELPPTYCQIFDLMKKAGEPIIEQMQASRKLKLKVSLGVPNE